MIQKTCVVCGRSYLTDKRHSCYCGEECHAARQNGIPDVGRVANVEAIPIAGCWIWMGSETKNGYGDVRMFGRTHLAHRVSYCAHRRVALQSIAGVFIRHTCDNPICVNPAHLEPGTHIDNMDDMTSRGRSCLGSKNHSVRLTEEQVLTIRAAHIPRHREFGSSALAKTYDVDPSTISMIVSGKNWRHLT